MEHARTKPSYSTVEVAEMLGVNITKIGQWIKAGELGAINVALSARGNRPKYRIPRESLDKFLVTRAVVAPPKSSPRRRQSDVPSYI